MNKWLSLSVAAVIVTLGGSVSGADMWGGSASYASALNPSWFGGCCEQQPSCCDGIWDGFCNRGRCCKPKCRPVCCPKPMFCRPLCCPKPVCCAPAPVCQPTCCPPRCGLLDRCRALCCPAPSCDPCCKPRCLMNLRGLLSRCCNPCDVCDTCATCDTCGASGGCGCQGEVISEPSTDVPAPAEPQEAPAEEEKAAANWLLPPLFN